MMNSNLVGCSTGRSVGFAPFRILSTKVAAYPIRRRLPIRQNRTSLLGDRGQQMMQAYGVYAASGSRPLPADD
jgi:hypothetical protein